jgi:hypothetical protein
LSPSPSRTAAPAPPDAAADATNGADAKWQWERSRAISHLVTPRARPRSEDDGVQVADDDEVVNDARAQRSGRVAGVEPG